IEHSVFGQPAHLDCVLDGFAMLHANFGSEHEGVRTLKNREDAEVHTRRKTRVQTHLLGAVVEPIREPGTVQKCKMNGLLDFENQLSGDEDVRYVRLLEFDASGGIRVEPRPHNCLDQRRDAGGRISVRPWRRACFHYFTRVRASLTTTRRSHSRVVSASSTSSVVITPTSLPSSSTGSPPIFRSRSKRAASRISVDGVTVISASLIAFPASI